MDRNNNNEICEISNLLSNTNDREEITKFFNEILTDNEIDTLSKRWRLMKFLKQGYTQREIAKELKISLCKITRGSKILKSKNSVIAKYLTKEKNNEYE